MRDPYAVLGLDKTTEHEKLKARYQELHDLYSEQRFKSGEEGNEGARKLQELEEAWTIVSENISSEEKVNTFGGDYGEVDSLIRQGKYNEAQDILDSITDRKGEWHYMQAIVFYKREWLTEARTQLEMAVQDDPSNEKYRTSLDKLKMTIANPQIASNTQQQQQQEVNPQQQANDMSNCLSTCCCAYCLTDCLCTTLRCC